MATGIRFSNPQRTLKNVRKAPRVRTELATRLRRSNEPKIVRGPNNPREACRKEASIGRAVPEQAMWTGISRTGNAAQRKVSVLLASSGAEEVLTAGAAATLAAVDVRA